MPTKAKRFKKATKTAKRSNVAAKPVKKTMTATKSSPAATITRRKAAQANISKGTCLYALAGRPTKAQFVKVYGAKRPPMTWEQRAAAGVPAEKFQQALKAKLANGKVGGADTGS